MFCCDFKCQLNAERSRDSYSKIQRGRPQRLKRSRRKILSQENPSTPQATGSSWHWILYTVIVPVGTFPWEVQVAFPEESQLQLPWGKPCNGNVYWLKCMFTYAFYGLSWRCLFTEYHFVTAWQRPYYTDGLCCHWYDVAVTHGIIHSHGHYGYFSMCHHTQFIWRRVLVVPVSLLTVVPLIVMCSPLIVICSPPIVICSSPIVICSAKCLREFRQDLSSPIQTLFGRRYLASCAQWPRWPHSACDWLVS